MCCCVCLTWGLGQVPPAAEVIDLDKEMQQLAEEVNAEDALQKKAKAAKAMLPQAAKDKATKVLLDITKTKDGADASDTD